MALPGDDDVGSAGVGDDDDLLPPGRLLLLLQLGSPRSSEHCSGRFTGRMAEDDDGDSGRGDGGDLIGLLPPPPPCGSGMMEGNTDDVEGWDVLQLVALLPVVMVSGEQLPLQHL